MQNDSLSVLIISDSTIWSILAHQCLVQHCPAVLSVFYNRGDPYPVQIEAWHGDWILSFKSDLVLPAKILGNAQKGAINIHPGPPKYRGVEGYAWAIFHCDIKYGVTCHHMVKRIDSGPIIATKEFSILPSDTPSSLKNKTGAYALALFHDIVDDILLDRPIPRSDEHWGERLYTYRDFESLQSRLMQSN